METISKKDILTKLIEAKNQRSYWEEKIKKLNEILALFDDFSSTDSNNIIDYTNKIKEYLPYSRNKKANARLNLFKTYLKQEGGRAHYSNFCQILRDCGDDIKDIAFYVFLSRTTGNEVGIINEGKGVYSLKIN